MSEHGAVKKFMYVNRKAPYGTIYALESLEVVLIAAAFDQDVSLAFLDDGVYQLKKGHQTKGIEVKNFQPTYRALDDYDVNKLYVERESLEAARPDCGRHVRAGGSGVACRTREADGTAGRAVQLLKRKRNMLHIVNKSPTERNALDILSRHGPVGGRGAADRGRRSTAPPAAAHANPSCARRCAKVEVYALAPDLEARGMANSVSEGVKLVDYSGFVDLVTKYNTCQSWL